MVKALVIRAPGTNCDAEMCRAFAMAGAGVSLVHLDEVIAAPDIIEQHELFGFPGGFSYGDDVASGRIFAMKAREALYPHLRQAIARGGLVIGACNGFQVLVQIGLLPGPGAGDEWPEDAAPVQVASLTDNQDARFCDRWVGVKYEPGSVCVWTQGIAARLPADVGLAAAVSQLPVAHGEGRFVTSDETLAAMEKSGQIALRYTDNYNGSMGSVAGICDASGRVFGLMPHPERFLDWTRHPFWTRLDAASRKGVTPGLTIFRNAVEAAKNAATLA
ncbi:MAG: phosphoribosylformylglycinamidine synthase subunit PurQ [Phycisphaerales bacterium]|jgi:phosphoribosylformylglycinamidine synthase